MPVRV